MGIKVVALHTDFRIYWPARLNALHSFLKDKDISMEVIEIAGKGSNYAFASEEVQRPSYWRILFPENAPEELTGGQIKKRLFKMLDEMNPDVVIAGAIAFPSGALAVSWGQRNRKRVIIFDDAKMESVKRSGLINAIKRAVYQGVDAMIYPAPDWNPTGHFWGFSDEQLFYGVDVVDNNFWERERESCPIKGAFIVAVGRQIPKKKFITLLEAYSIYSKSVKDNVWKLVLVGDGPEHQAILDYITKNQLGANVLCFPFLSQEELAGIYQKAKALVCCSNSQETWGLVINEAMACGCPIIASNECGATNTLVQHGINGYRFSCGDIEGLSKSIIALHELSKESYIEMRKASKLFISKWGLERFCQGCFDAFQYSINQPKKKTTALQRFISSIWKGRYRPT